MNEHENEFDGSSESNDLTISKGDGIVLPTEVADQKDAQEEADSKDPNFKRSDPSEKKQWVEWTLPNGDIARYTTLVGLDIRMATRQADGDQDKMGWCLMVMAVKVNGKGLTLEEFDEMHEDDCFSIMLRKQNFTSGRKI